MPEKQNQNQALPGETTGFAVLPYVKAASERVGRVLRKFNIWPAFRPIRTLGRIFKKPKDQPTIDRVQGLVYKVNCRDCSFTYFGESKRSWNSRGAEHDPGSAANQQSNSMLSPRIAKSISEMNYHKRLFLESWHSTLDSDTVNERKPLPRTCVNFKLSNDSFRASNNDRRSSDEGGQRTPKI